MDKDVTGDREICPETTVFGLNAPKSGRYTHKAEDRSALRGLEEKPGGEGDWGGKSNGLKKKEREVFLYSGAAWKGHRTTAWRK